jgi:prepilin-type N-terminal cleavage/methylation domain-containing protein
VHGAFTLIEVMVVMAIMATLAAVMAYALSGAQESAQIAKTRSLIARLNTLVTLKYDSFLHRRLPIVIPAQVLSHGTPIRTPPSAVAKARCDALRLLMRMEMPDRWTDITDDTAASLSITIADPVTQQPYYDVSNSSQPAVVHLPNPMVNQAFMSFYNSVQAAPAFTMHGAENQGAKCLYLLVTMGLDDSDVLENFSEGDIADYDHTGCKVFLDGWGNPINFLRWAPGFVSPLQPPAPATASEKDQRGTDQTDPTGFYKDWVQGGTFALYPLIYSAGADGHYDIVADPINGAPLSYWKWNNNPFIGLAVNASNRNYATIRGLMPDPSLCPDGPCGSPVVLPKTDKKIRPLGNSDNIHNHSIGAR